MNEKGRLSSDAAKREPGQQLCGVGLGKDRFKTDFADLRRLGDVVSYVAFL
jgi:hypothetical protein